MQNKNSNSYTIPSVDKDKLRKSLAEVTHNGWSLDDEESTRMVRRAVGAPVRDQSGRVCTGLSICTSTEIDSLAELLALKDTAIEAANKISKEPGWNPQACELSQRLRQESH